MTSVPKEYANVRRYYLTKYGDKKGSELFDAYMKRRQLQTHKRPQKLTKGGVSKNVAVVPWIPMRTLYQKTITHRRGTNLVVKRKL